jgi:putative peptidoglycan lipid II flippase
VGRHIASFPSNLLASALTKMTTRQRLSRHYLFRNAGITAALSGAGAATGLALDALILFTFGVGYRTDAFFAALTIPTLLGGVVSIQSPKVLIPVFSGFFERNEHGDAWALLRNLLTTCLLLFVGVALAGVTLSGIIVPLEIPGLKPDTIALAVWLSRVLFVLVACQGLASILQSVLYARHSYLVSCSGKLVMNIVTIIVVFAGHTRFGIQAVAGGMVLGSLVQLGLLGMVLAAHGFRYRWTLNPSEPGLRAILGSFGYPMVGHILGESGAIVQNILGSFLGSGSLTLLRYASRIVQAIAGILLGSVVQVTMPLMARHAAANDLGLQRRTLLESIQLLSLVGVPICIWLIFMAEPLVVLFFQRGQFSSADAVLTAVIIRFMVPDVLLGRLVSVTQTLFYVNSDLRTPFISTLIYTVANTIFAVVLAHWLGVRGIGMAVSLASLSNAVYMILKLQSRFGPVGWSDMRAFALRLGTTSVMAAAGFAIGSRVLSITTVSYSLTKFLAVAMPSALGFSVFAMGVLTFRLFDTRLIAPIVAEGSS